MSIFHNIFNPNTPIRAGPGLVFTFLITILDILRFRFLFLDAEAK